MENTELLNQNQHIDEYQLKDEDVFRYESKMNSIEGNTEALFSQNAAELDFKYRIKDATRLRAKHRTESQISSQLQFQRVLADGQAKDYRSEKDRKKRAKTARKTALKAQKLIRNRKNNMSPVEEYESNKELNRLHYEMGINRIQSLAKNDEEERALSQKAKRAYLVREMESLGKTLSNTNLPKDNYDVIFEQAKGVFSEYLDALCAAGELSVEAATLIKGNSTDILKKMQAPFDIRTEIGNVKDIYEKLAKQFEEYKKGEAYASKLKDKFKLNPNTYAISSYGKNLLKCYDHYVSEVTYQKYLDKAEKYGAKRNEFFKDRNLQYMLRFVEFDAEGNVLPGYEEADRWNTKFVQSMLMEFDSTQPGSEIWKARKEVMLEIYNRTLESRTVIEELLKHKEDFDWMAVNYPRLGPVVATMLTFESNMNKVDPLNKAIRDEIASENPELVESFNKLTKACDWLLTVVSNISKHLGYDVEMGDLLCEREKSYAKIMYDDFIKVFEQDYFDYKNKV